MQNNYPELRTEMPGGTMMRLIRPNSRDQLTAKDFEFITSTLGGGAANDVCLNQLLLDGDVLDLVLDHPKLYAAVREQGEWLDISASLYFYVLLRPELRRLDIEDREIAGYLASLLTEFARVSRMTRPLPNLFFETDYLVDLLSMLETKKTEEKFLVRTHIGNYTLFMSGLFPERISFRYRSKAAPGLSYYETMGRSSFAAASGLNVAWEFEMSGLYRKLADSFHLLRLALNQLSELFLPASTQERFALPMLASA